MASVLSPKKATKISSPEPTSPAPTETSADVQQAETAEKRRVLSSSGRMSTLLTKNVNPANTAIKTLLGE
jgi:hypothetical protein